MEKTRQFENIVIAVGFDPEMVMVVTGPEDQLEPLKEIMDWNPMLDEFYDQSRDEVPKEPGLYLCTIEFWFQEGYFEGYPAPGESSWFLVPTNLTRIA